jgi:polysaccharide biosynthesis/export protein
MIRKLGLCAGMVLMAGLGAYGQSTASSSGNATASSTDASMSQTGSRPQLQTRYRYQISRSDTFGVQFPIVPEYNQTVTVQPDGYVFLQGVGPVYVMGQTVPEVTDTIRKAYSKVLHDPIVSINLSDFQRPYFTIDGEVQKPGKYELREDITVVEALAVGGGLTDNAKHSTVFLFHHTDSGMEVHKVDAKHMLSGKESMTEDIHLQPGDIIWVPTSFNSKLVHKVQPFLPNYGFAVQGASF